MMVADVIEISEWNNNINYGKFTSRTETETSNVFFLIVVCDISINDFTLDVHQSVKEKHNC